MLLEEVLQLVGVLDLIEARHASCESKYSIDCQEAQ